MSRSPTPKQYDTILQIIGNKRKRQYCLKDVFDAIFYLLKSGCQWRMLPSDFPRWELVYYYFQKWSRDGSYLGLKFTQPMSMPLVSGISPWVLKDFRSSRRLLPQIQDGFNRKGLVSDQGDRKQSFYVLKKWYSNNF